MQKKEDSVLKTRGLSFRQTLFIKILVTTTRFGLFFFDLWTRDFDISDCLISMLSIGGVFMLGEVVVWYRVIRRGLPAEWSMGHTVGGHLFALTNIILMGLTAPAAEVKIHQNYFSMCIGQMVNYLLTIICVYSILNESPIKNRTYFMQVYQPVDGSLIYLFVAIYVGMLFDMLAFSGRSIIYFYILTAIIVIYLGVRFVFSNQLKKLSRIICVE